jgi:hypothetical protein
MKLWPDYVDKDNAWFELGIIAIFFALGAFPMLFNIWSLVQE